MDKKNRANNKSKSQVLENNWHSYLDNNLKKLMTELPVTKLKRGHHYKCYRN